MTQNLKEIEVHSIKPPVNFSRLISIYVLGYEWTNWLYASNHGADLSLDISTPILISQMRNKSSEMWITWEERERKTVRPQTQLLSMPL